MKSIDVALKPHFRNMSDIRFSKASIGFSAER